MARRAAVAALCLVLVSCATFRPVCEPKVVYTEVRVPVPIPCPVPPTVPAPELLVLGMDPATATVQDLLQAIAHDVAELRRYAAELATILEGYRPAPGPG